MSQPPAPPPECVVTSCPEDDEPQGPAAAFAVGGDDGDDEDDGDGGSTPFGLSPTAVSVGLLPNPAPSLAPSAAASPRASLQRNSLSVPSPLPPHLATRRCSARLLSLNVREALRQLRQREHKKRVTALVQRNADFYRRQRCCECGAMASALALFSAFSLYVVFAYGFYFGERDGFRLAGPGSAGAKIVSKEVRER